MNAVPDAPPQSATSFWSIERFVAFILGPVLAAGAGWLSTFLAREIGISLNAESIVAVFSIGGLSAAGLAYKWLHGRQVEMQANALLAKAEAVPGVGGFLHTTLADLEGLAQSAAHHAVEAIQGSHAPPEVAIPAAASDPAPASAGQVADAGAAPAQ